MNVTSLSSLWCRKTFRIIHKGLKAGNFFTASYSTKWKRLVKRIRWTKLHIIICHNGRAVIHNGLASCFIWTGTLMKSAACGPPSISKLEQKSVCITQRGSLAQMKMKLKMQGLLVWLNEKTKLNLISKAIPLFVSTNFTIGTRAFAITCDTRKALAYQQNKQLSIQLVDKSGKHRKEWW